METKEQRIARQIMEWRERKLEQVYMTGGGWYYVIESDGHMVPGPASIEGYSQTHDAMPETVHLNRAMERAKALGQDRSLADYTVKPGTP